MKKIILLITTIINISVFAQCTNIVHLDHNISDIDFGSQGYYYKDINNVLNNFEGTYLYTSGSISLKIKLQKKLMSSMNGVYCRDMIIGGAEYIKDGGVIFNSIPLLNTFYSDGMDYNLYASSIYTGDSRGCDECSTNEKWLIGYITDPITNQSCEIFIRKIMHNGQEAIKIRIRIDIVNRFYKEGDTPPPPINLPSGEDYILIKQ